MHDLFSLFFLSLACLATLAPLIEYLLLIVVAGNEARHVTTFSSRSLQGMAVPKHVLEHPLLF